MAKPKSGTTTNYVASKPKKSAQGRSTNTKLSATSSRSRMKRYRGQGKG